MFITLSKTIGRVGGFRIGVGKRITSKNAWWMCLLICFVAMFRLMWYMMVLAFWLMYAMCYGIWWCCKKLVQGIVRAIESKRKAQFEGGADSLSSNYVQPKSVPEEITSEKALVSKYCPNCGEIIKEGNTFCIKCGTQI